MKTARIKSDSCNGKRTGSAEPETPRKSLRIYSWTENQEPCGGATLKVRLTESTCCLDNLNIQNMAAVEADNGRVSSAKVEIRLSSEQHRDGSRKLPKRCLIRQPAPNIHKW